MAANDVVISSSVDIDSKSHVISLTPTQIIIEGCWRASESDTSNLDTVFRRLNNIIELEEVVGVHLEKHHGTKDRFHRKDGAKVYLCIEMQQIHSNAFCVYYVKRMTKHRWRHKKIVITCRDHTTAQKWVDKIQYLLNSPEFRRPKKLLVFVNPFGGRKKGPSIYKDKVAPLFDIAGISTEVIMTQRQNHARDVIQEYDLLSIDGVVCVGGDGTFSEVLNGLLDRQAQEERIDQTTHHQPARPKIRVGIIPAGSTDAIVYTTTGINDPITSALHIILGDTVGMDVCALYSKEKFLKYSVSMIAYGYYGDLLQDSVGLRWMGPARYNWCGVKKFLAHNAYDGEVSFLLSAESDSHPRDGTRCTAGCFVCAKATEREKQPRVGAIGRPVSTECPGGNLESEDEEKPCLQMTIGSNGWHTVRGRFIGINSFSMSCRTGMTPEGVSPASHLGDGCLDLCIVYNCSRFDFLRHLHRCADRQADQFDFSFIQVYRVKEFMFKPLFDADLEEAQEAGASSKRSPLGHRPLRTPHNSVWNIDGEVFTQPNVHVRYTLPPYEDPPTSPHFSLVARQRGFPVRRMIIGGANLTAEATYRARIHTQLISLFARGVEKTGKESVLNCPPCCSSCEQQ